MGGETKDRCDGSGGVNVHFQSARAVPFSSLSFETSITGIDIRLARGSDASEIDPVASSSFPWCSDSSDESCSGEGECDRIGGSGDLERRGSLTTTLSSELAELPLNGLLMRTVSRE
jgi:hypothetical protein